MLAKALLLRQLYLRKLSCEKYCESIDFHKKTNISFGKSNLDEIVQNCALCELSKYTKERILGRLSDSNLAFITLKPLSPYTTSFEMVANIAKNVFKSESYSLLSLIKCNSYSTTNQEKEAHIATCKEYLRLELERISPKILILFGESVAKCILNSDEDFSRLRGRILNIDALSNKQRNFIVTYAINDLIKNPSLKKDALSDFNNAKRLLES